MYSILKNNKSTLVLRAYFNNELPHKYKMDFMIKCKQQTIYRNIKVKKSVNVAERILTLKKFALNTRTKHKW